ncbi:hypothetical protein [Achromobacter aloeverae]|uniref:Uncharacterized protein n=1 Tax=Achromobacter aloeverae TaxID=1750518 RepID=A0A4Q1HC62_9BURK|nr:hypothetical protein [Achromobacter aloeverae]RXN83240.1 hypothetical protein C7R54_27490 [Achromobacter aloeverae]
MELDSTPPIPAPEIAMQGFDGLIDDQFIAACNNQLPFYWPRYVDSVAGDQVCLWANGTLIYLSPLPASAQSAWQVFTVDVHDFFDYTGKCNLYFVIYDVNTRNPRISEYQTYVVQRNAYPAPSNPTLTKLAAPVVAPLQYNKEKYDSRLPLSVLIAYDDMKSSDVVTLKFELRRTTSNYRGKVPTFYDIQDIPVPITPSQAQAGKVTVSVPGGAFWNVDENIASVYYIVRSMPVDQSAAYLDTESYRNLSFMVDVVPPYSGGDAPGRPAPDAKLPPR